MLAARPDGAAGGSAAAVTRSLPRDIGSFTGRDTVAAQKKFKDKYDLPYDLLADDKMTLINRYDLIKPKNMYGKLVKGVKRTTYLVGPDQKLIHTFENVKPYFGTDKGDPSENAAALKTRPWTVEVSGEVGKPKKWDIDEILKSFPAEERVYRLRCVEAWSMVIPWDGFPLGDFLKKHEPTSRAKYVAFESVVQPDMPGVKG